MKLRLKRNYRTIWGLIKAIVNKITAWLVIVISKLKIQL
jgi:hypothetical protein